MVRTEAIGHLRRNALYSHESPISRVYAQEPGALPGPRRFEVDLTMNSSSTVSAELGLRLVVPQQTIVPLVASLFYSKDDPYAIRIAFHVGLDEPVEWIFARDLLSMGIEGREGLGDVVV